MGRLQNMGGDSLTQPKSHRKAGSCPLFFFISKQLPAAPHMRGLHIGAWV